MASSPARGRHSLLYALAVLLIVATASPSVAQTAPADPTANVPGLENLNKYPGLLDEFGRLITKFQHDVQFPAERSTSQLLPLLPAETNLYLALPNYGDASHQLLTVFRQELLQNASLREWWASGEMATSGPKVEDFLTRFSELSQYLGDEMVLTGTVQEKDPHMLLVAEIRKPGLKPFLQQMVQELAAKSKSAPGIRILDPQDLSAVADKNSPHDLLILVRPDVVVAGTDVVTIRHFNARLDRSSREFGATPFAQRILHSYNGGVSIMGAADLHSIVSQFPATSPGAAIFQRTGFADMKYLAWEHKNVAGHSLSQAELSFTRPRHGIAAWLGAPRSPGGLTFVSPGAAFAADIVFNQPSQIYDDIQSLATASNPRGFAQIEQSEQALGISIRNDILGQLAGELTFELDTPAPPRPVWRAVLRVRDPVRLQQTLARLMAATHVRSEDYQDGAVTYHSFVTPSPKDPTEVVYAFVDGYLVFASSRETAEEAVRLHRSGGSLAKSSKFLAALPSGYSSGVSALFYQDPIAMAKLRLQQLSPAVAQSFAQFSQQTDPTVVCLYGDETSIRESSTSAAADAGAVLIIAAIAIPNLMRSRIAANEASAVGSLRTLHTAQVAYAASYPDRGFASDLATLGPDPNTPTAVSADHAALLVDEALGGIACTAGKWCESSGYRFTMTAVCGLGTCNNFVAATTPTSASAGGRSFCSSSDGVVRYRHGPPLTSPPKLHECRTWIPLEK